MRITMAGLLAVALHLLTPSRGAAQPQVYCPKGTLAGCLAVEFVDRQFGMTMRLQNLQGSLIGSDDFFRLTVNTIQVRLTDPSVWWHSDPMRWAPGVINDNFAFATRTGTTEYGFGQADLVHGRVGPVNLPIPPYSPDRGGIIESLIHYSTFSGGAILEGCRNSLNASIGRYPFVAATCPSQGLDGWLEISMPYGLFDRTTNELVRYMTSADITVEWRDSFAWTSVEDGVRWGCTIGVDCDVYSYAVVAVAPEPGTWALMGTGLIGLAGVAARRRRRDA